MKRIVFIAITTVGTLLAGCGGGSIFSMQKPTVAQMSILKQFNAIDRDGDKKVSSVEAVNWLNQLHKDSDSNKDGLLEEAEIPVELVDKVRNAKMIVLSYDRDADERLTPTELQVHANVMFQQDHNADGFLDPGEIKTAISAQAPSIVKGEPSVGNPNGER